MIGDSIEEDIIPAHKAGLKTVIIRTPENISRECLEADLDIRLSELYELMKDYCESRKIE